MCFTGCRGGRTLGAFSLTPPKLPLTPPPPARCEPPLESAQYWGRPHPHPEQLVPSSDNDHVRTVLSMG